MMRLQLTRTPALVLGGDPRVNLLPPALVEKAILRRTRGVLAGVVVASLIAVGAGYGLAQTRLMAVEADLAAAQERTLQLLSEQSSYSEAVSASALVAAGEETRTLGASTEILWSDLFEDIQRYLPDGASIVSGSMIGRAAWEPELLASGPLRAPRIGTLQLVVASTTVLDATDLVRRLSATDGFVDATPDSIAMVDGVYTSTITMNVGSEALSGRFAPEAEDLEVQG